MEFPWEKQSKQCWLIVFDDTEALKENIDFRPVIWDREKNIPKGISQIIPLRENKNGNIVVKIKKKVMRRSYISIDYPSTVMDGGYYYTIDLPAYLKGLEK